MFRICELREVTELAGQVEAQRVSLDSWAVSFTDQINTQGTDLQTTLHRYITYLLLQDSTNKQFKTQVDRHLRAIRKVSF